MHSPCSFRIGSQVSGSTRMIDIGYMLGMILETNPMAPKVLSVLAVSGNLKMDFHVDTIVTNYYNYNVLVKFKSMILYQ